MERTSHDRARPDAGPRGEWLPLAVIEHDAPGGRHFDLLRAVREPAGPEDRPCATWRCSADPSTLAPGHGCGTERIDDHRAAYLSLPGPRTLSDGRGTVHPVAVGRWRSAEDGAFEVEWADGRGNGRMTLRFAAGETELRRTDR